MIRPATTADIPSLIALGAIMHATTSYAKKEFCRIKTREFLAGLIEGEGVVFVAEYDGELAGGVAGAVTENWFNRELIGYEYAVFVAPSRRHGLTAPRLIKTFMEWARIQGATSVQMGVLTGVGVEGTGRLYESLGLAKAGAVYEGAI